MTPHAAHIEPIRKLSPWRVMLGVIILAVLSGASVLGLQRWQEQRTLAAQKPWFAAYVDITATPRFPFEQMGITDNQEAVLSFIVSLPSDPCTPSWGGAFTLDRAGGALDLDRRIARLRQQGGNVAVSFGGLKNDELAVKCTDEGKLYRAYKAVIDRYNVDTIDLDLEQAGLSDTVAGARRAAVIAKLQTERRKQGKNLAVWVTLPVAPQGLSQDGTAAVGQLLDGKVDLAGVNVMTMDYGQSREKGQSMLDASTSALSETHRQLGVLYQRAGTYLSDATLWTKMGATPMIGQNDFKDEVFYLEDAEGLNAFARSKGVVRMSMWSGNRDVACGGNYVDTSIVSDSCSGVEQEKGDFARTLSAGFNGSILQNSGVVTTGDAKAADVKDDPANSPYQIWTEEGTYLQGTKVVWRRNVYEAKWWTQGEMPDNPVLQTWETPWRLIGPVLPGEKPLAQATLPNGTYPEWSGTQMYDAGQRVLFKGAPYQAKWWNQGQSPAAASSNPDGSPWVPLTQAQINEVEEQLKKQS